MSRSIPELGIPEPTKIQALRSFWVGSSWVVRLAMTFLLYQGCVHGGSSVRTLLPQHKPSASEHIDRQARQLVGSLRQRGEPEAELHLALAVLYARMGDPRVFKQLAAARKLGISPVRLSLVEADASRRQGHYDEAMSILVRILVHYPEQPHALIELWKTLYEALLRGVPLTTDIDAIRQRLADLGLRFPAKLDVSTKAQVKSQELTDLGYNALLAKRTKYAAQLFEAAIDAFPSNARAYRGLGVARISQFDRRRATSAFLLYLDLTPDAPDANEIDRQIIEYWKNR